jgi:hypothetical protein
MIRPGKRVQIRAICKRDAYNEGVWKRHLTGMTGEVLDRPLHFNPEDATFSGTIKIDKPIFYKDSCIYFFASIQVKKLYRRNQAND